MKEVDSGGKNNFAETTYSLSYNEFREIEFLPRIFLFQQYDLREGLKLNVYKQKAGKLINEQAGRS